MRWQSTTYRLIFLFLVSLGIILIFTLGDYLVHKISEEYSVPPRYFPNKIIFGTIIGFITLLLAKNLNLWAKSLIFSLAVSTLLQIRYFIEGYALDFVVLFLFIHLGILFLASFIVFRLLGAYKLEL